MCHKRQRVRPSYKPLQKKITQNLNWYSKPDKITKKEIHKKKKNQTKWLSPKYGIYILSHGARQSRTCAMSVKYCSIQGSVLLLWYDAVASILANGSAAFKESCTPIGWKDCGSVKKKYHMNSSFYRISLNTLQSMTTSEITDNCLFNSLLRLTTKTALKLNITGPFCKGNPLVTGGCP